MRMKELKDTIKMQANIIKKRKRDLQDLKKELIDLDYKEWVTFELQTIINKM